MSLNVALTNAASGLSNINVQLGVVSQNIANASTPGYSREVGAQESAGGAGFGMGVRSLATTVAVNQEMQSAYSSSSSTVSALQTTTAGLAPVVAALGTVGQGNDLSSLLGTLQAAFSSLNTDPSNQTQQSAVVASAQTLASSINTLSNTYTAARQSAQDSIVSQVSTLNTDLTTIGDLSNQIIGLKAQGEGTADLENQRNAAMAAITSLVGVQFQEQPNGDMQVYTAAGTLLPTRDTTGLVATDASLGTGAYYPGGGLPAITLNGADITANLTGGSIGANIALRDQTLPTQQAELDEFSQNLASRFDAQGLTLFGDASGQVPAGGGTPAQSGYVGFASQIQVNPAVASSPSLVRDGTHDVSGSAAGASAFSTNTAGTVGFNTLIQRVLTYSFGDDVAANTTQPALNTTGLGPTGTLSAPYSGSGSLADIASSLTAAQAQVQSSAQSDLSNETAVQTALKTQMQTVSGVSTDSELSNMVQLQNSYAANAKIITTVNAMFGDVLAMVS